MRPSTTCLYSDGSTVPRSLLAESQRDSSMEMILSFLAMKWYQYVSDLVIVCKNMHNLDTVVDLGGKSYQLEIKAACSQLRNRRRRCMKEAAPPYK